MSTKPRSLPTIGSLAVLAVVTMTTPSSAAATAVRDAQTVGHSNARTPSDISAARRTRQTPRRSSANNAYGNDGRGSGGFAPRSTPAFGYGVGDNSHNQTW